MKLKILIYTLIFLSFAACAPGKKDGREKTLTVGVMSSLDYLPLAVATSSGYFTQEGIEVNLQKFYSANERDAALQSGNLDGCILDYTGAAIQRAGGVNLYLTSQCDATFELIAGKNSGVKSVNDLRGKNFAVARNTVIDFCTDMVLKNAGIAQSEVQKSEINKIPLRLEMLRNEKIDLTVLPDPFATMAKSDGNQFVTSLQEMGYHVTGIVFTATAIDSKAKTIRAFYRAYNRAISDLQQRPIADFQDILINEIGFSQPAIVNVKLPEYNPANLPEDNDLEAVSAWLREKELVPAGSDIHSLVDSRFVTAP